MVIKNGNARREGQQSELTRQSYPQRHREQSKITYPFLHSKGKRLEYFTKN